MKKILLVSLINFILWLHLSFIIQHLADFNFINREVIGFLNDRIEAFVFEIKLDQKCNVYHSEFDVDSLALKIKLNLEAGKVIGNENIQINVNPSFQSEYVIFDCGKNLDVISVKENSSGKTFFFQKGNHLFIKVKNVKPSLKFVIDYEFQIENKFFKGFTYDKDRNHFYTLSEPNFSKFWYICKEDPSDKFFAEIEIISPKTLIPVSNGILIDSLSLDYNYTSFKYRSIYPINHYLLFIAGGDYRIINDFYTNQDFSDTLKLEHFVFGDNFERAKEDLQLLKDIYDRFRNYIGPYPFKKELYGIVEITWPFGGMEHQTRSAISSEAFKGLYSAFGLQAHEFVHHWFGNYVTCKTWKDIWLNEAFATYFEHLAYQSPDDKTNPEIPDRYFYGSVYKSDGFIFSRTVYDKGAWILKMLRNEVGDEKFFLIINEYLKKFKFSSASTEDFISICNQITKRNLSWFFDQWLYSRIERPFYKIIYSSEKKDNHYFCKVIIKQIQPEHIFKNRLKLKIIFEDNSTQTFNLFNDGNQAILFSSSKKIKNILLDPENQILKNVIYQESNLDH